LKKWLGVFGVMLAITVAHYEVSPEHYLWHEILERLYYLPIVFAAWSFGRFGGVFAAACAMVCYLPHILPASNGSPQLLASKYAEMVIFLAVGFVTGLLSDRERQRRDELVTAGAELENTHAELQRSVSQLRQADRLSAIGQLVAGLAHEIRNPLGSIEGAVDICSRTSQEERRSEFFGIIKKETARLNTLLTGLLDFARTRTPQVRLVRVQTVVSAVTDLVNHTAQQREIRILSDVSSALEAECDPGQIQQAVMNVTLNAIQATRSGGTVRISVTESNGMIALRVQDEGSGMTDGDLTHLFDPFFTTKEGGTGLGLAISYQILLQHGGQITAERNRDLGMTFTLRFPRRQAA
jgi:signal transduction histidine kinase